MIARRGYEFDVVKALMDRDAKDKVFFGDAEALRLVAGELASPARLVTVQADEEHNVSALRVEDRSNGYARHYTVDLDFVSGGEYRTLLASYRDIRGVKLPVTVTLGAPAAADADADAREGADAPEAAQAGAGAGRDADVTLDTLDALVEFFITAGKRGVAINRYKGLGEMNPEQLWSTTMKPDVRTLLQVRAEDHTEADLMFTTLMGDQVEPRRKFIEDNALDVKNLDI